MGTDAEPDGTELLDIDVVEVSLVDRPAIRRRFARTKREPGGDDVKKTKAEGEGEITTKAAGDAVTALVSDYLAIAIERATELKAAIESGTVARDKVWSLYDAACTALWKAQEQTYVVAKSLGVAVEKADRKMTARRRAELKSTIENLTKLLTELEDDMGAEGTTTETKTETKTETPAGGASGAGAAGGGTTTQPEKKETPPAPAQIDVAKAIADAADAAAARVVAAFEARVKTVEDKVTTKAETPDLAATVEAAVAKAVVAANADLEKRLKALEGNPGTGTGNKTETTDTTKSEGGLWSGLV